MSVLVVDAIGLAVTCLVCLPAWPIYNQNQPKWVPKEVEPSTSDNETDDEDESNVPKTPKKTSIFGFISRILF
ncbi:hypothetical protein BDEG_20676 [Batrachochytrium dendrobatidis JEL423]|nr:hypothetical protein BDEG_20676 [Batrachochytrium dendrobatidis JEL423]